MILQKKYSGITVPVLTPVLEDETVDEKGYRRLIQYLLDNGVHGVFACGTLGETMSLTQEERDRAIRIAADQCQGKAKVFAGVMDTSTKRVIENIKRIADCGCDAAVITPVFYDRHTSQGEIIRLLEDVAAATDIDLVAYNIPTFVVEKIEPATVAALADIDKVKAYKDSAANFNDTVKVCNHPQRHPRPVYALRAAGLRRLRSRHGKHVPQGFRGGLQRIPHRRCGADAQVQ